MKQTIEGLQVANKTVFVRVDLQPPKERQNHEPGRKQNQSRYL